MEIATFHSGIGGAVLLVFAPFAWQTPPVAVLGYLAAAGLLTVLGAMALAWAYARAETQALVPIEYSGFVWASVLGWAFFREPVTAPTIAGGGADFDRMLDRDPRAGGQPLTGTPQPITCWLISS